MIFDVQDTIINSVGNAIDEAEIQLSEEALNRIKATIENSLPGMIEILTYSIKETWIDLALGKSGWGTKYAKAIRATFDGNEGTVFLDSSSIDAQSGKPNQMFAEMMEHGVSSWSIKDALLTSDKAKVGPTGVKYIVIPMPVATPRKKGQGHMMSKFGGREMSSDIHKLVKAGGTAPEGTTVTVSTMHGSKDVSIAGITRYNTRQRHSSYALFRMISSRSKGWQYPDVPATPIFASVIDYVNKRMGEVVSEFCKAIVDEYR